ncbi:MAG TPA: hypothetical protein VH300_16920 [Thermoleophilaceae bacterium]|jgi:hypothetical protein|nr:hypothetical protein [Thermoleophilaceae bacterium]
MAPRSLRPQLNQIRAWVRQGRTDAWIAHQLEVSVKDLRQFKRDHELEAPESGESEGPVALDDDLDLRAEDDALVAAALDAESEEDEDDEEDAEDKPKRRRGRRGGRGRRSGGRRRELEGTFDHGEEGYGLWLDPAVQDDPVYAEHWAGHRPVTVVIEADRIVIKRAGEDEDSSNGDSPADDENDES